MKINCEGKCKLKQTGIHDAPRKKWTGTRLFPAISNIRMFQEIKHRSSSSPEHLVCKYYGYIIFTTED